MTNALVQLCLVLVLLSNRYYVNTDRIDYIDTEGKWLKIGQENSRITSGWYLRVTDEDIEMLKKAIGTYPR